MGSEVHLRDIVLGEGACRIQGLMPGAHRWLDIIGKYSLYEASHYRIVYLDIIPPSRQNMVLCLKRSNQELNTRGLYSVLGQTWWYSSTSSYPRYRVHRDRLMRAILPWLEKEGMTVEELLKVSGLPQELESE